MGNIKLCMALLVYLVFSIRHHGGEGGGGGGVLGEKQNFSGKMKILQ